MNRQLHDCCPVKRVVMVAALTLMETWPWMMKPRVDFSFRITRLPVTETTLTVAGYLRCTLMFMVITSSESIL